MHRIEIPDRGIVHEFPSDIEEMTQEQFVFFIELVLQYVNAKISLGEFKNRLILKLLNVKHNFKYFILDEEEREQIHAEMFRLSELCDSFFEEIEQEGQKVRAFKLNFTRQFFPVICGNLYGPEAALSDATFCEYRLAHGYYAAYQNSKSEEDLNRLIAVLYRPGRPLWWLRRFLPGFDGQKRVRIRSNSNPLLLEHRAKKIAGLPFAVRYGILLWFAGCEYFLIHGTVMVEGRPIDLSIIYDTDGESSDSPDIGLIGILYTLAESKVFGSIEETDNQGLYDVMIRLYQLVRQSKSLEAKYKSHGVD